MTENDIRFVEADEAIKTRILREWGEKAARHMHLADGFSIVDFHKQSVRLWSLPGDDLSERSGSKGIFCRKNPMTNFALPSGNSIILQSL